MEILNYCCNILLSIGTGVLASYLFLICYLKRKRPKIIISQHISKLTYKGEINYFFKFVNTTNTDIFDVNIELVLYKPVGEIDGTNLVGTDIKLFDNFSAYIPSKNSKDPHNLHAIRIRTTDDLESEWTDPSSFLQLTIIAKHSLSGLNKVFHQYYRSVDCITDKKFKNGDDIEVK